MIYFLFFLSIGLITILALVINRLQNQKLETSVAQQKLREKDTKITRLEHVLSEQVGLIKQLNRQINLLQEVRDKETEEDVPDERDIQIQKLSHENKDLYRKLKELENNNSELRRLNEEQKNTIAEFYNNLEMEIEKEANKKFIERIQELEKVDFQTESSSKNLDSNRFSAQDGFILIKVQEQDLYSEEIISILIDILKNSLNNVHENSRRQHIITDIVHSNYSGHYREEFKAEIQNLFRDYKSMNSRTRKALKRLGFEIVSDNSNYKMIFQQDSRYTVSFSKTPSDWRAGRNIASDICNLIL
ncbi:hypothetical protein [Lyngbya confervoides]|uniref:Uncharacterized protein n=1 Tax=Lyngbya confervoides BDU141951 TaxID=1574623 RepID=A0ABD4SYU7_9CYAN|nr:hypothetical protein [Lyngbya confervoides]MCM1981636.1 hypothetical protein [Lyngbya confervoides BDU141951]